MIVVDYLQLLVHPDPRLQRSTQVGDFSRSLKLLAKELEIPIIAVSQLNRASEHRRSRMPTISDLRESGAVEQDADVIVLLHRDVEDDTKAHELTVAVAKNRFGPPGQIRMQFDGKYQRIEQTIWRPSDVLDTAPVNG
jgi:replicative DNA helicase